MSPKFTPGPWAPDIDNWVKDSTGKHFISIKTEWRSREEILATRALVAAAPEMFALFQEIARGYPVLDAAKEARALIDKITGGAA